MITLKLLKILRDDYIHGELDEDINGAIKELEAKDEEIERLKAEKDSLYKTIMDLQTVNTYLTMYHKDNK